MVSAAAALAIALQNAGKSTPGVQGPPGIVWTGPYDNATTYGANDGVTAFGSSYVARVGTTGVAPVAGADSATWLLIAKAGSAGTGSAGSMGLPAVDMGLLAVTYDPIFASGSVQTQAGIVQGVKIHLTAGQPVTGALFGVQTAGAGLSGGTPSVGLFTEAGARVAVTGDLTTQFQTVLTPHAVPFTAPYTATASGAFFLGFLVPAATTQPSFRGIAGGNSDLLNVRAGSASLRFCQLGISGQTTMPATAAPSTAVSNRAIWAGLY